MILVAQSEIRVAKYAMKESYMREKNRVDTIYEVLRDRICVGDYQPGDVFHEAELGQEFEVSRTPIRQVLQRLAFEHLAVVRAGVGTIVEDFVRNDIENYLEIHARLFGALPHLKLAKPDIDCEEVAATLLVRSSRLSSSTDAKRFWQLFRSIHSACRYMLTDDLIQDMDALLFHRTGPALMHGVRSQPDAAAQTLQECVKRLVESMDASSFTGFFRAQSKNIRDYKTLLCQN